VPKGVTLIAVWAIFAAAAVGVGFGAAGLVGDPFTSTTTTTAEEGAAVGLGLDDGATAAATPSPSGTVGGSKASSAPTRTAQSRSPSGGVTAHRSPTTATTVTGEHTSVGGYVSAACRDGLVSVSAVPAVGWEVEDRTSGRVSTARVRFEPHEGDGAEVELFVHCSASHGRPVFSTTKPSPGATGPSGHDSGDDDGHDGGDDHGGGDGSGTGSDD
jgi:hypothetical protein